MRNLDAAIVALQTSLGDAWASTIVAVVTEFGRTVAINGTRGTDHGTASCAFLCGGAVDGGRVIADWPGLATGSLHDGRDLRPTTDLRGVFQADGVNGTATVLARAEGGKYAFYRGQQTHGTPPKPEASPG